MKRCLAGACAIAVLGLSPAAADATTVHQWGQAATYVSDSPQYDRPTAVTGIPDPVVQVVATNSDDYALTDTGQVFAWGAAKNGELGTGRRESAAFISTPQQVQFPGGVTIASLTATMPDRSALAIDTNGNVWGWGYDQHHQLCSGGTDINTPIEIPVGAVTLASGAGDHALYYSAGTLYACGLNGTGDLGDGSMRERKSTAPVTVVGLPDKPIVDVVSAQQNSGAVMADGSYYDWGRGTGGQLGDGRTMNSAMPVEVPLQAPIAQLSQGGCLYDNGQTIALLTDGSVWSWGTGGHGQLGDGATNKSSTPVAVDVPAGVTFTAVDSGGSSEYAIDSTGDVWAWGQNQDGQLGTGRANSAAHDRPVSLGIDLAQVSSTAFNVVGLK
jgi:alpha-tubulin suppressor-like RCC1 family protein